MKYKLQLAIFIAIFIMYSCKKEKNIIVGYAIEVTTNKPIKNYPIVFEYSKSTSSGGGFFDGWDSSDLLYTFVKTDENGKFEIKVGEKYENNNFYVSDGSNSYTTDCDYNLTDNKDYYYVNPTSSNVNYSKKELYFYPKGLAYFSVEKSVFENLNVDTIIVKSTYNSFVFKKPLSETTNNGYPFNGYPNKEQKFEYQTIKNSEIIQKKELMIFIYHSCDSNARKYNEITF